MQDWLARTCEIVDRFHPAILYFDWWIEHAVARPYIKKAAAYYYNKMDEAGLGGVINYKHDEFPFGSAVPDVERGQFADIKPFIWQTDAPIGYKSWGYIPDNEFKTSLDIVRTLCDVVSKNGRMLLNVGPKGDGTITEEETKVLTEIGKWLKTNGEAIYNAKPYKVYGEGDHRVSEGDFNDGEKLDYTSEDFRFTTCHGDIYAIAMKAADDGKYVVKTLRPFAEGTGGNGGSVIVDDVSLLGGGAELTFSTEKDGLHINCPVKSDMPVVFKIRVI